MKTYARIKKNTSFSVEQTRKYWEKARLHLLNNLKEGTEGFIDWYVTIYESYVFWIFIYNNNFYRVPIGDLEYIDKEIEWNLMTDI